MAVYTQVRDDDLKAFLADYGLGTLVSFKGIAEGVENTNYFVVTSDGRFILTLYEERVDRHDLPFFLGLLEHLSDNGITCPVPLKSKSGNAVTELAGRAAAIVTFLEGFCVHHPAPTHCRAVGETLAQLHLAGETYDGIRANALGVTGWRPLFDKFSDRADQIAPGLTNVIKDELAWLESQWPDTLPQGIIHADLFPDNVFFLNDALSGLIDFYFACNDAFALDVAICINAWCFDDKHVFSPAHCAALLSGYQAVRKLSNAERAALPTLCRGAAMRFLLTRAYDWLNTKDDALVRPHDPRDYLKRLQFHQTVNDAAGYGLDGAA